VSDALAVKPRALPAAMTIRRPGAAIARAPDGIASAPFWAEVLFDSAREGENTIMRAHLEPGVVTHWHTHPRGQLLYVLSGVGLAQRDGGPLEELRGGDCVWFAPDERHWHGAARASPLVYIAFKACMTAPWSIGWSLSRKRRTGHDRHAI
jgi:quercetin dioxygenase-like cupin family protein